MDNNMTDKDGNPGDGIGLDNGITEDQAEALGSLFLTEDEEAQEANSEPDAEDVENGPETGENVEDTDGDEDEDGLPGDSEDNEPEDEGSDDDEDGDSADLISLADMSAKVRLPDGSETTVQELVNGNLRYSDYTRKRMEDAEAAKAVEAQAVEIQQQQQLIANERNQLATVLQQFMPQRPDPSMAEQDPIGYMQAKDRFEDAQRHLQEVFAAQRQHHEQQQAEHQQAAQAFVAKEAEAFKQARPEFKDPARFERFVGDAKSTLMGEYGFTEQDLSGLTDHRMLNVVADLVELRQLKAQAPKAKEKIKGKPPVMKSKRKSAKASASARVNERIQKAQRTGDITGVADILGEFLTR